MRASGYNWKRLDISWGKLAIDLGLYWSKFLFSTSSILLKVVWNIPIEEGLQREEDLGCPSSFLVKSAVLDPSADVDASGKGRIVSNRMLVPLLGTSTGWCWPEAVVLFNRRLARWSFAFIIITDLNVIYLELVASTVELKLLLRHRRSVAMHLFGEFEKEKNVYKYWLGKGQIECKRGIQ